jgi:3-oxoacyl-[acyl-carrier-protein] synthase-3
MSVFSKILSSGSAFPKTVMHNKDFESFLDTSDDWIRTRTGIVERRIADPKLGESTLSLALEASRLALKKADISSDKLGLIIVGTVTPENLMPTTANQLQAALKASNAFSFDLQAACSSSLYGLSIADQYIRNKTLEYALVIGVETLSTILNWRDRGTAVIFGDGAGAFLLGPSPTPGIIDMIVRSDGRFGEQLCLPHGCAKTPPHSPEYRMDMTKIKMNGSEIFKLAVRAMVDTSLELLERNNLKAADVDYFLFHQANTRIIDMCSKALNVPANKTWINIHKYGNTSAATLPVCLDEALAAGAIKKGDLVLMTTFGGGTTWGSALVRM